MLSQLTITSWRCASDKFERISFMGITRCCTFGSGYQVAQDRLNELVVGWDGHCDSRRKIDVRAAC
jgi:hypothetical protein